MYQEFLRPEQGFDAGKRSLDLFLAFQQRCNTWVYQDSGSYNIQPYLNFFKPHLDIIDVDLPDFINHRKLAQTLLVPLQNGRYNHEILTSRSPYLVLRHLDQAVFADPHNYDFFQVLSVAQKYAGGVMYTVSDEHKENSSYHRMLALTKSNYFLDAVINDFSPLSVIL